MPLILGFKKSQDFFIEDIRIVISQFSNSEWFEVFVEDYNQYFKIDNHNPASFSVEKDGENYPVTLYRGDMTNSNMLRIVIDVDRAISICRGSLYRKSNGAYLIANDFNYSDIGNYNSQKLIEQAANSVKISHNSWNRESENFYFLMDGKTVKKARLKPQTL